MKTIERPTMDVQSVARAIDIPIEDWPGNCSGVAAAMLRCKIVSGRFAYGHYRGDIDPLSLFTERRALGFTRHAWIILCDGTICDPTRWVFLREEPAIWFGPPTECGDTIYDEGGQILAIQMAARKRPERSQGKRFPLHGLTRDLLEHLCEMCGIRQVPKTIDLGRLFWLANLPPGMYLPHHARQLYGWLKRKGLIALVPIDFRRMTGFEKREVGD